MCLAHIVVDYLCPLCHNDVIAGYHCTDPSTISAGSVKLSTSRIYIFLLYCAVHAFITITIILCVFCLIISYDSYAFCQKLVHN